MTQEEFDQFYAACAGRLVGHLYAMTGDLAEAEDVVQEAFVKAWSRRESLAKTGRPEAWIRTVAWRLAVSRWRRGRRAIAAYQRHGVPADIPAPSPDFTALVAALRDLTDDQRRAIVLHHLVDLSIAQVAEETGCPTGTVKARLSRGRAALARALAVDEDEPAEDDAEREGSCA